VSGERYPLWSGLPTTPLGSTEGLQPLTTHHSPLTTHQEFLMSIQILTQVCDEMRRLAIAGSVVAAGDFRLKKLIAPLEQAGTNAPVFAKVAEAVKHVVDGNEKDSAGALLDLTTLVNAILYTQGETGAAGTIEPIETTELGGTAAQTSARMLKPLLEALSTTGSGRLELIREAYERGMFSDLRLVKPALAAIDDPYGEIADLIAENVVPLYGKAILPELRATFDLNGRAGHPRRLRLMHALDPAGTRELVKQALDAGSKEVRVVAIECLGAAADDLSYLIEQASAKAQEVRQAAYLALAAVDHPDAIAVLQKAATGKDLDSAVEALRKCPSEKLLDFILAQAEQEIAGLAKTKDKKEIGKKVDRTQSLLACLAHRQDDKSEAFVLKVFGLGKELAKVKGDTVSGADLNQTVVLIMSGGSKTLQTRLAAAHAEVNADGFSFCFEAALHSFPAAKVFEMFSPYFTAKVDGKKKKSDPVGAKQDALCQVLAGRKYVVDEEPPLDPRWLDLAVEMKDLSLVGSLVRPGHPKANTFLSETFITMLKKAKSLHDCHLVVAAMVHAAHPKATDAFIAAFGKQTKTDYFPHYFAQLILDLPKSAVPKLEAMIPNLSEKTADALLGYIQQLRDNQ
jgi:hypothetical protein